MCNDCIKMNKMKYEMNKDKQIKDNFDDNSINLTKKLSKEIKKQNGIFFTPKNTIKTILSELKNYTQNITTILEPSCGSGQFINELKSLKRFKDEKIQITGIEYNKTIYDTVKKYQNNKIDIIRDDYLNYNFNDNKYDLIIGNPPYFVMKKADVNIEYNDYYEGRPNIFILFIIKSLHLLNDNGILSFVLPKNFLNCGYYDKTRKYIYNNYKIINILECNDNYIETKQDTIIFMLQKVNHITKTITTNNNNYCLQKNGFYIFNNPKILSKIKKLYENSKSLNDLGFKVNVGNVVWNQCKNILTNDSKKTRLIYSSDIDNNNELILKDYTSNNENKKNYIDKPGRKDPLLILNRGYGVGNYKFNYCLLKGDSNFEYLIENHLICIKYNSKTTKKLLLKKYNDVIMSLQNDKTKEFISLYFGNNSINTTELNYIIPIYGFK
jgi:adenine-specific DNA-methyltransferase